MKNNKLLALLTLFMCAQTFSSAKQDPKNHMVFSGEIKGYGDGIIQIAYNDPFEIMKDSIVVKNDKFKHIDTLNSPRYVFLKIMGNENLKKEFYRIDFFLEDSDVKLTLNINDPANYKITGSKSYVEYHQISEATRTQNQDYINARNALRKKDKDGVQRQEDFEEKKNTYLMSLKNNPLFFKSHSGPYRLWGMSRYIPLNEIFEFLPKFDSSLKNNVYLQYLTNKRDGEQRIEPGNPAPNFKLKDFSGKEYTLDDFKGNYLLLDFEASWCKPCKLEIPFLKESHEKYSSKGLTIISVNLDKTRELWEKDIKTENLPWKMLSNLDAFDGDLTKAYSVTSIPRIFLIDPEGNIVSSKIRKQKIIDLLEEIYNN